MHASVVIHFAGSNGRLNCSYAPDLLTGLQNVLILYSDYMHWLCN